MNKSLRGFKHIQLFLQNTKLEPKGKHKTWYNSKESQLPLLLLHNSNIIFNTLDLWSSFGNWSWNFDLVLLAYTTWTIALNVSSLSLNVPTSRWKLKSWVYILVENVRNVGLTSHNGFLKWIFLFHNRCHNMSLSSNPSCSPNSMNIPRHTHK
jgi:hypothetical protein